jgi:hypothetical protein
MDDTQQVAEILLSLRQIILEREGCEILANMRKHAQSPTMLQVLPGGEFVLCEGM